MVRVVRLVLPDLQDQEHRVNQPLPHLQADLWDLQDHSVHWVLEVLVILYLQELQCFRDSHLVQDYRWGQANR